MQITHKNIILFYYIIAFLFGVLAGYFLYLYTWNSLQFSTQDKLAFLSNVVAIISLAVTVILAVIVLRYFNKKDDFEKTKKEILVGYFTDFREDFECIIRSFLVDRELKFYRVTAGLKRFRMRMGMIIQLGIDQRVLDESSLAANHLKNIFADMWTLFTETPRKGVVDSAGNSVINDNLQISSERIDDIADKIFEIQKTVFELIIEITKTG